MSNYLTALCNYANNYDVGKFFKAPTTNTIFHYTNLSTLGIIIDKNEIRFVDRFFLNDYSEGIYVLDLCLEIVGQLKFPKEGLKNEFIKKCQERKKTPQYDNFFVFQASFSSDQDSLAMWNYYGKKGCNLGFNVDELVGGLNPECEDENKQPKVYYGKIEYDKQKQIEIIKNISNEFYEFHQDYLSKNYDNKNEVYFPLDVMIDKIMTAGIFFKSHDFKVEKEYRLAYSLCMKTSEDGNLRYALIKNKQTFFEREGMFVPCVDLKFSPESFESITIAPTLDFEYAKNSILRVMGDKFQNISPNTIIKSNIPVRF